MSSTEVVIVGGVRTPFAKAGTKLKDIHPVNLGQVALCQLMAQTEVDPSLVDEVIIGNTGSPSDAANISRVVALRAGFPLKTSCHTVHRNCASALESISTAYDKIKAGSADVVVAGGTESMSQMPLIFSKQFQDIFGEFAFAKSMGKKVEAIKKLKLKYLKPRVAVMEGLTDPFSGINMGQTAEILAKEFHISREEQDRFAMESHEKAVAAQKNGNLAQEITPIFIPPKYKEVVAEDIGPREGQSMEKLGKMRPYFDRKFGSITVANACPITDGAAMVMLMSRSKAQELGLKPWAKIRGYAFAGLDPRRMGLGPVYSTPIALQRAGVGLNDIDVVELNEAFAAQVIACTKAMASDQYCKENLGLSKAIGEVDPAKLNINGGAIALGHPVGATGTRLVLTAIKQLQRSNKSLALATLCIGGGQGGAMILEREA